MKQKLIALILVLCSVGALLVPQVMAEEKPVSRIEWVQQLVKAFDMTVEENNYPDNYYSDMEETSAGYRDLLVAVEFGVIDLEAGSAFEPDQPATREFAAHTLNFCLGFQLDQGTAYTYAESAEVSYPDDLQVAVNRGWFALQDGKVLPQQTLTSTEATAMLKDAAAVMGLSAVSEDYNSVYKFLDGVIVVPDGTDVSVQDDTVTIVNCPVTIQSGDLFVIYQNTIPVGYQATSVAVSRQNTVISAVRAEDGAIFEDVDAQGVIEADLSSVIPLDGSEVSYYVEDLGEEFPTYAQAQAAIQASGTIKSKAELNVKRKVDLGNGGSIELNFKAKNAVVSYNVSVFDGIASVKLDFDYELHHVVKLDYPSAFELDDIRLAILGVPGVGGVTFSVETEASIASDSIEKGHASQELSFSKANGVRFVPKIGAKSFTVSTEGTAKVGLVAKLGITEMPVLNAYGYLKAGVTCELKQMTYNDAPLKCVHFAAYLYANGGFEASVKLFNYSRETSLDYPIYTDENSPIRIVHHYEDGKNVPKCTRDNVASWFGVLGGFDDWYTSGDSPYMSSGWSSGFGGTGYGRDGQPIVIYTYSLDDDENATITSYKGNATSLIIPSKLDRYTVVAIGNEAFKGNSLLRAVSFPDTVTAIGDLAFFGCNSLSSITLNDGLTTIGTRAFASCTSLWAIDIPDTVTKISAGAFAQCSALHYVKLSSTLEQMDAHAFFDCDSLTSITIPKTLTKSSDAYINEYAYGYQNGAFYNCDGLKNVTIEDGATIVAGGLFANCPGIESITIPNSVTEIGDYAFGNCIHLTDVKLSESLTKLGGQSFAKCTALEKITIPNSVEIICAGAFAKCSALSDVKLSSRLVQMDAHAFFDCDKLTFITIPKTLAKSGTAYIPEYAYDYQFGAFYNCDGLKDVTIENGTTVVASGLFANCPGIEAITIPDSVTSIGEYAFGNCAHLTDVKLSDSLTKLGKQSFAKCSALEKIAIPDSVEIISAGAFAKCSALSDVKLSSRLVQMDAHAFFDCDSLTSITIPKTLTKSGTAYIPEYVYDYQSGAFYNCDGLKDVTIEDSATVVAGGLFANCPGIETITIPDSVTEIGDSAFFKATGLKHVDFGKGVKTINANAFNTCTSLLEVKIPDSMTSMGKSVFANCTSLTDVTLPSSRENIMASTFAGCTALEKLVLPESVKNIRDSAFKNCTALKELVWSKAPELIESNAFYNCDAITEMDIPATVTSVGYQAFYDCDGLTKITIPDSVTSLGDSVFYDCDALTDVKLGAGITTIPASAFRHCDALEQLTVPRRVTAIKDNAFKDSVKFSSITIPRSVTSISANAFSYLDKLTIYGVAGTYAETFAKTNSIKFVDRQVSATSASLDQTALTLNKGASGQLMLTVTPEDFTDEVVWKSSDTAVVTVSDTGLVKAVGVGTATIKVSVGKASASCKVTVLQPVTSISLNRSSLTMEATDTFQLQASVYPSNAADQRVQWTSSDPAVASVDENGLVTALKKGTSTVTAAALDGSGVTRTCQVTVSNTAYICTQPEQMESPHDYPDSCTDVWLYTSPGAQKLYVTFDERTRMEDGFDYLYIYDGNGQQIGKYTGTELAGTTVTVPGDMVKIQINSDGSGSEWGFKVTGIRAEASAVVVNPIGGDNAPACQVDGQTLTVTCDRACVAAYKDADGNYVRLIPTANANGSYSYTLPEGVAEVTVAVRGDLDGDGKLTAKEARRVMTAVTRADSLDALQMLCADLNGDGKISAMEARQVLSAVTNSASVKW